MSQHLDTERSHEDAWYRRVVDEGFFEREGFRQLQQANLAALRLKVPLQHAHPRLQGHLAPQGREVGLLQLAKALSLEETLVDNASVPGVLVRSLRVDVLAHATLVRGPSSTSKVGGTL